MKRMAAGMAIGVAGFYTFVIWNERRSRADDWWRQAWEAKRDGSIRRAVAA